MYTSYSLMTRFLQSFALLGLASLSLADGARAPFREVKGVHEFTGKMIVRPLQPDVLAKRGYSASRIATLHDRAMGRVAANRLRYYPEVDEIVVRLPRGMNESTYSEALMATGDYEYAVPNWRCFPVGPVTPNDPLLGNQWHHRVMESEAAWGIGRGTNNVTIAVVDTGVYTNHADLRRGIVPGYNSVTRLPQILGGQVEDLNGHGTHVAGDAAAQGNNAVGVVGEGWSFKIMPVRTSDDPSGGAEGDDIMAGARWAIENGAKVASASYSGVDDPTVGTTGTYIKARGGLFLYAAGNDNRNLSGFSYRDTIVVGASNPSDTKAGFSAYGRGVGLFAPGESILSTTRDGGYAYFSGTSMATPVANGACALIWSINPDLEPDEVQDILYSTCDQIGSSTIFGHGRVNLYQAALKASQSFTIGIHAKPQGVGTKVGRFLSGTLANIANGTGSGYKTASAFQSGIGSSTAVELTYRPNVKLSDLRVMEPTFKVNFDSGVGPTVQLYMYNYSTARYDLVKSTTLSLTATSATMSLRLDNLTGLMASNGTVKSVLRVFSPIGRRGSSGGPFTSTVKFGELHLRKKL